MKKRIQLAALAGAVLMALSFSACAVDMSDASAASSTSSESSEAEATPEPVISVDESKYEDNLDGLADYMKKKEYISGDATEMAAAMIGAEKGVKYTGSYEGTNNITMDKDSTIITLHILFCFLDRIVIYLLHSSYFPRNMGRMCME